MRRLLAVAVILPALVSLGSAAARAGFIATGPGLTGNDTGGIIQVTPDVGRTFKDTAVAHCSRWSRYAGITSIRRVYGDYIGFRCVYDRRYDPRKAGLPQVY